MKKHYSLPRQACENTGTQNKSFLQKALTRPGLSSQSSLAAVSALESGLKEHRSFLRSQDEGPQPLALPHLLLETCLYRGECPDPTLFQGFHPAPAVACAEEEDTFPATSTMSPPRKTAPTSSPPLPPGGLAGNQDSRTVTRPEQGSGQGHFQMLAPPLDGYFYCSCCSGSTEDWGKNEGISARQ